jgi:anti-sigma factor RsiW
MSCKQIEPHILDYLEDRLPLIARHRVEAHLAACSRCAEFARRLQQLDAALARSLPVQKLSLDFDRRLRYRIATEAPRWSEEERVERQRRLAAELEVSRARLQRGKLKGGAVAAIAGWLAPICFAGWLLAELGFSLASWSGRLGIQGRDQALIFSLLASAVFLLIGLAPVFARPYRTGGAFSTG